MQVRREPARHVLGHVPAYATLFLGHTATANDAAAHRLRTGNVTNSRHSAWVGRGAQDAAQARIVKRYLNETRLLPSKLELA